MSPAEASREREIFRAGAAEWVAGSRPAGYRYRRRIALMCVPGRCANGILNLFDYAVAHSPWPDPKHKELLAKYSP